MREMNGIFEFGVICLNAYALRRVFKRVIHVASSLRSGVPYIFCRGGKVRLIQLLDYLSVASPESGLFSDWSRNKRVLRTEP